MSEICDGMMGFLGKLNHSGLNPSPAKSFAADGLRERDNEFFKEFYFLLLEYFRPLLSVILYFPLKQTTPFRCKETTPKLTTYFKHFTGLF